jgi:hypothetical protein
MSNKKFLCVYRSPTGGPRSKPSPAEMETAMAEWMAWKAKFAQELIDLGAKLAPGGAVVRGGTVTDGPFVEGKEVMGGYMIVETTSMERAVEIVKALPKPMQPSGSIEIREMASS